MLRPCGSLEIGFFIDHRDFVKSRSKIEVLYYYLKIIVPTTITVLSVTWLVECFNTIFISTRKNCFYIPLDFVLNFKRIRSENETD